MAKSLQQTVTNFTNSAPTASADWLTGAEAYTGDPTALAAQAGTQAVQNYAQAWTSGRVQAGLQRAGRNGWITGIRNGQQKYSLGISSAGPKYQAAMSTWLPIIDSAAATVKSMPSGTLAASQARAAAFMQILYNAKRGL